MNDQSSRKLITLGQLTYEKSLDTLKRQYNKLKQPIYDSTEFEIVNGLLLRNFRFYKSFLVAPSFWVTDLAEIIFRSMVETNIYLTYMEKEKSSEIYLSFKKYGIGQEKQFKAKLAKYANELKVQLDDRLKSYIESNSDTEIWDELVDIDLKNWKNVRELADESNLKVDYDLIFDRYSPTVHGHYNSIIKHYLRPCNRSLHRNHLIPDWEGPYMDIRSIYIGIELFHKTYQLWIEHWNIDDKLLEIINSYIDATQELLTEKKMKQNRR